MPRGNRPPSVARKLSAVRTFSRFPASRGALDGDPATLVGAPRLDKKIPAHLSWTRWRACSRRPNTSGPLGRRDPPSSSCSDAWACG